MVKLSEGRLGCQYSWD